MLEAIAVDQENIRQSIVVVVEDGDSISGGLNDVLLVLRCAGDIYAGHAGLRGNVFISHDGRLHPGRQWFGGRGNAVACCHAHLSVTKYRPGEDKEDREAEEKGKRPRRREETLRHLWRIVAPGEFPPDTSDRADAIE